MGILIQVVNDNGGITIIPEPHAKLILYSQQSCTFPKRQVREEFHPAAHSNKNRVHSKSKILGNSHPLTIFVNNKRFPMRVSLPWERLPGGLFS